MDVHRTKSGGCPNPRSAEKWFVVGRGLAPAENVGEAISLPFYMTTKMREDNILPYTMTEKRRGACVLPTTSSKVGEGLAPPAATNSLTPTPTFLLTPQAQKKSSQKKTPERYFALCGGRQWLLALDLASFCKSLTKIFLVWRKSYP